MLTDLIFSIIEKIVTGEVYKAWQDHKLNEAIHEENVVASLSDVSLDKRVQSEIVRN